MNERKSWDPSLVKKFNSSNHFKLLNQLRNEVKKYPLNNKKNSISNKTKDINQDNVNKQNDDNYQYEILSKDSNKSYDKSINKSNVSFNNSKNFSIYSQTNINNSARHNQSNLNDQTKPKYETFPQSFKERLDQIDLK